MIEASVTKAAQEHARAEYPRESCGLVAAGKYFPCRNIAEDPLKDFVIAPADQAKVVKIAPIEMVIHSHPNGPMYPSKSDMEGQVASDVPWAIVPLDEDRMGDLIVWGDRDNIAPIVGRQFVHGVSDCYSIIRDVYALGKDKLAEQDIGWPFDPIVLPEGPRDDQWWDKGEDLYLDNFKRAGFKQIDFSEIRSGDVYLIKVHSDKINHGGVLVDNQLIIQHFPNRLSRREPASLWARNADVWLRYVGPDNA
jgi:proteasome lid subunit RPN8/RPN11